MLLVGLDEPALYDGQNLKDFRPPYAVRRGPPAHSSGEEISVSRSHAIYRCLTSSRSLINTFLLIPAATLQAIPVISYTRVAYAIIVYIKCYTSLVGSQIFDGQFDDWNIADLLFKVVQRFYTVSSQRKSQVPTVFYQSISHVYAWLRQHEDPNSSSDGDDLIEPMLHFSLEDCDSLDEEPMQPQPSGNLPTSSARVSSIHSIPQSQYSAAPSDMARETMNMPLSFEYWPSLHDVGSTAFGPPVEGGMDHNLMDVGSFGLFNFADDNLGYLH